jgi:hypothetical protein
MISTYLGAAGSASVNPHRGVDLAITNQAITPALVNGTTVAHVFSTPIDLTSPDGRHVDLTTDVTYMFKGEQRTDTIFQRYLHLGSAKIGNNSAVINLVTQLGISGNSGQWGGVGYPNHLHMDISTDSNRSPWIDSLARHYSSPIMSSLNYSGRTYYDPLIFLYSYNYPISSSAGTYNR